MKDENCFVHISLASCSFKFMIISQNLFFSSFIVFFLLLCSFLLLIVKQIFCFFCILFLSFSPFVPGYSEFSSSSSSSCFTQDNKKSKLTLNNLRKFFYSFSCTWENQESHEFQSDSDDGKRRDENMIGPSLNNEKRQKMMLMIMMIIISCRQEMLKRVEHKSDDTKWIGIWSVSSCYWTKMLLFFVTVCKWTQQ